MTRVVTHAAHLIAPQRAEPTPLLRFLAGEFAEPVAGVWPAPHESFLALPAARRHAAAILLGGVGAQAELDAREARRLVERGRDAALAGRLIADAPAGLMKALRKLGERLWLRADYAAFLELFAEPNANRVLRHLDKVTPAVFAPIAGLPPVLREAAILRHLPGRAAAYDLDLAFKLAASLPGAPPAAENAGRWARAKSRQRLFEMAAEALQPERFRPPEPAPDLPPPFERITTRKRLAEAALGFKNCLRDFANDIAVGRMAAYVVEGCQQPVAMALTWDAAGWRLAEAEGRANADLPEACLREIVRIVAPFGVRTGPALSALVGRLTDHGLGRPHVDTPRVGFVDQLELGDLWD